MDSGYSIKECRIRLKQGDEISHDTIIQLYLLWLYPQDHMHLLRIYTHQTWHEHGYWVGSIFAVRLTKADPKCPGICSCCFCSTNFTINITKSCMHAKQGGGWRWPQSMLRCFWDVPITLQPREEIKFQIICKWMTSNFWKSHPALNFWKLNMKQIAKLACSLARPGINPWSLLSTSSVSHYFVFACLLVFLVNVLIHHNPTKRLTLCHNSSDKEGGLQGVIASLSQHNSQCGHGKHQRGWELQRAPGFIFPLRQNLLGVLRVVFTMPFSAAMYTFYFFI